MVNMIETLQQRLGHSPLQKVNPNTQEVDKVAGVNMLAQAIIPAVTAGLYKVTRSPQGAQMVLRGNFSTGWAEALFGENADMLVNNVATYAAVDHKKVLLEIERTGEAAVKIIQENITTEPRDQAVMSFMKEQRNTILHYLPAALQIGLLLDDTTIDDKTNKMDGPISGLMHKIEKAFSGTPPEEPQVNR
jgi:hypothetical protein